jgi:hypothetical protein
MTTTLPYGAVSEGPNRVNAAIAKLVKKQRAIAGTGAIECEKRNILALEAALIHAKEWYEPGTSSAGRRQLRNDFINAPIRGALEAAEDSDTLGDLTGTLVLQAVLELFTHEMPLLSQISTDFSAEPVNLNQTATTRKLVKPTVRTFNNELGADGRPKGWETASAAQMVDVSITMDELVGVPIPLSLATLSSTQRNLFQESAPTCAAALAEHFTAKVFALCTPANFNFYAAVTPADANGFVKVPNAYPTFPCAEVDFARSKVSQLGAAMTSAEVPRQNRTLLLNVPYFAKLSNDPSLTTFFAGQQHPEIITEGQLPRVSGFKPLETPTFPGSDNRVGMALHKAGLIAKTRLPQDLNKALGPGAGNGAVTQIVHPQTGMTIMLITYSDPARGYAEYLPCIILGAAVGDKRGGIVLTS